MRIGRLRFITGVSLIFFTIWGLATVVDKVPDIAVFHWLFVLILVSAIAVKFCLMAARFRDIGVARPWWYTFWALVPIVWFFFFPACLVLPSNFSVPKSERKTAVAQ